MLLVSSHVEAAPLVYSFEGVVTTSHGYPTIPVSVGERFSGILRFDPALAGAGSPSARNPDTRLYSDVPLDYAIRVETIRVAGSGWATLNVFGDSVQPFPPSTLPNSVRLDDVVPWANTPFTLEDVTLVFGFGPGNFPGGVLPMRLPVDQFTGGTIYLSWFEQSYAHTADYIIRGDITSLRAHEVPEPSVLLLLGCAIGGWVTWPRNRARRNRHSPGTRGAAKECRMRHLSAHH
jgi:hypothetical protein